MKFVSRDFSSFHYKFTSIFHFVVFWKEMPSIDFTLSIFSFVVFRKDVTSIDFIIKSTSNFNFVVVWKVVVSN